ncbi:aspartate aminotransferase [Methylohalomonas lacus]|uniref:Aminotransferase n=1 Tax=Methylohalomonas lacus TaxID=398773 RepID=A0AAE3HJM2_9GAMM|nr:pyridoxal phosphate-dependent aminotransferase [Methylohalomonas lacus]MCS3903576.1 aspartate aminotransferase [Methylohalomonas lacus]
MEDRVSHRANSIKPSPTLAVSARAAKLKAAGQDILSLSAGEPDFDTPDFIKNAAIEALNAGFTKYTAVSGTPGLRQAIADKFKRENGLEYSLDQILVSCGCKHSIYNLMQATLNPGDEVIIPAPYWVSYPDMAKLAGAEAVIIKTGISQEFKISPEQLRAAITDKTRMLVLNSPANPTGAYYSQDELAALGEVLIDYPHVLIASDDIYEHILWAEEAFHNIVNACPALYERTIVLNGVSKAYSMTGWRIGYAAGAKPIIEAMEKIQSQSTSNPTSIAQVATQAALEGDQTFVSQIRNIFQERHDLILEGLNNIQGIRCAPAGGTFYIFPNCKDIIEQSSQVQNDLQFAEYLLEEGNVAVVPGSAFGAPGYLRLSFACSMDHIREGLKRMEAAVNKLLG